MNRLSLNSFFIAFFIGLLCLFSGGSNRVFGQTTYTAVFGTPGLNTWTIPPGVSSITITCIGAGGAGGGAGNNSNTSGGGGGGGASVTVSNYAVTPGQTVSLNIGSGGTGVSNGTGNAGGATFAAYSSTTFISAAGGSGGTKAANGAGGAGGAIANNIPVNTGFKGGNGGNGAAGTASTNNFSGSGGGGAGTTAAGGNAVNSTSSGGVGTVGSGGATYGGAGRAGISTSGNTGGDGVAAINTIALFGGGGSGATVWSSGSRTGGNGANGGIIITYTVPATVTILTWNSSGSWVVPAGVCNLWVECWGGGGGGGGVNNTISASAGGGGGGSYTLNPNVTVTAGSTINYTVGAAGSAGTNSGSAGGAGGTTIFSSPTPVSAAGGAGGGGSTSGTTAGAGGAGGIGGTYNGGAGASGASGSYSGGGGGSAGIASNGRNAITFSGGFAYNPFGGYGGNGVTTLSNGNPGFAPGGGGGGAMATSSVASYSGGAGAAGRITIMYSSCPCAAPTSVTLSASSTSLCAGGSTNFTTSLTGGSVGGGNWEYQFELTDGTVLQPWGTTSTYNPTGIGAATYNVVVKVRSSACNTLSTTSNTVVVTVNTAITTPTFTLGASSTRCQGAGSTTYTASSTNTTGITYSIDGTSTTGGVTINASTGAVTYPAGWSGTTTITASAAGCGGPLTNTHTVTTYTPIAFANVQSPTSGTICTGGSFTVYGKAFISGVTPSAGATAGLVVELGYSTTNSNPNTWTNWQAATFNIQVVNDDEYVSTLSGLAAGTYYYAFRYSYNGCAYVYGGTSGIWSNNSGVLTVNDCFGTYASAPNLTSCNTTVAAQGAYYNTSGSGANLINSNGVNFQGYNFGSYFQNSAGLILKGAEIKTFKNNTGNVCSARMYYRVYPSGSPSGAFTSVNLPFYDNCSGGAFPTGGPCNTGDQKWRDIAQNIDLTTYSAGTYSLEVYYEISGSHTSTSGCGTTQFLNNSGANYISSFTILAAPTANNTGSYCEGTGTVTLSASNGGTSYSWSGPNSFTSSTQNPTNGSPSTSNAGTYTVTVNLGGCTQTAQTTVTVNPIPSVIANSNSPICAGQSLNLTSTDGYNSYAWSGPNSFSNATQNPTLTNFQAANAGTYTVTVTGTGGCQATSSTVVALTTSPSAANNGPVCVGGSLSLSTNSATSYSWSGPNSFTSNVQNPTVSASATTAMAGTYTVSVIGTCAAATGVVDNFSDGNFTANPVWTVQAGGFVGSSNFLKGNSTDTDDIISTPSTQVYGTWNFDYRFHTTAYTSVGDQFVAFFVTSTNAGLQNSNGYYVYVESSGQLLLRRRNGVSAATTIISATISGTNELNTNWHTIKVIRGFTGLFELYFDGVLKGTGTDNTYTTSTHLGPWIHGKFATDNHEVDNISCSPPATAQTIVVVDAGPSIAAKTGTICSGSTYTLSTAAPDVVPGGTTYSWSFTANPNITGATTGTNQTGFTQTLTNTSGLPQTIVYTVTPSAGACPGATFTVTVTVNPRPVLSNGTVSACTGVPFSFTPTGTNIPSGTTYSWSAPSGTNFSGGAAGSGATTVDGTLTLSSGASVTATYTVTPTSGTCPGTTFTVSVAISSCLPPTPFTACNLVVYKVGDGNSALASSASPISIEEINTSGNLVQSISVPFTGANQITQNGTAASVGILNSYNGFLSVPGYNTSSGTALNPNAGPASPALVNKVNSILDANQTVLSYNQFPSTGVIPMNGDHLRSTIATSATTFYAVGSGSNDGLYYFDGTNYTRLASSNLRVVEIFNNELYVSSSANVFKVGTGLPTSGTQTLTALLPTYSNSGIYGFSMSPDGCTLFVADQDANSPYKGVTKYTKSGSTWAPQYTYISFAIGLTADYSGTNPIVYVTTSINSSNPQNKIEKLLDNPGGNNFTTITTGGWPISAGTNYRFAGIDFTPNSTATIANTNNVNAQGFAACQNGTGQTLTVAATTSSSSLSYQWYSNTVNDLCGATAISGATNSTYTPPISTVGTVYYFVKISSACVSTFVSSIAAVTVNQIPVVTLNCGTACSGVAQQLSASVTPVGPTYTYSWSPATGLSSTTISNPTSTITTATNYTVVATNSSTGCPSAPTNCTLSIGLAPSINAISPP